MYFRLIPESVRWLLAKQKGNRAKKIVCKAAKMNGVTLSESLLSSFESEQNEVCWNYFIIRKKCIKFSFIL